MTRGTFLNLSIQKTLKCQKLIFSPWKVGIGATWRTPPVAADATGGHRRCALAMSASRTGNYRRTNEATKSVATNQNSRCDWRTSPNPNFPRTVFGKVRENVFCKSCSDICVRIEVVSSRCTMLYFLHRN